MSLTDIGDLIKARTAAFDTLVDKRLALGDLPRLDTVLAIWNIHPEEKFRNRMSLIGSCFFCKIPHVVRHSFRAKVKP